MKISWWQFTWLYAFFVSIQQSHSILMTWVCCLLCSFNFCFLCLSGSASPLTIWGYFPSRACFSVYCPCSAFVSLYLCPFSHHLCKPWLLLLADRKHSFHRWSWALVLQLKERLWIHVANSSPMLSALHSFSCLVPFLSVMLSFFLVFCLAW